MRLVKGILFAWVWLIASAAAGDSLDKESVFRKFEETYTAVHITPYATRDHVYPSREVEAEYYAIMRKHWRVLLSDIDRLPVSRDTPHKATTVSMISEACEALPPLEYLDMVEAILNLTEKGEIPNEILEFCLMGTQAKNGFIAVNFKHPRVKEILRRARPIFAGNEVRLDLLELAEKGKLAENFDIMKGYDGTLYPEMLPGMKRKRPHDTFFRTLEWIAVGMVAFTVFAVWRIWRRVEIWRKRMQRKAAELKASAVGAS